AVSVAVVAMPAVAAWRAGLDRRIDDRDAAGNRGVVRGQLAEADELEESRVDHRALVESWPAVPNVIADCRIGIPALRQTDEVRVGRERSVRRHRPAL